MAKNSRGLGLSQLSAQLRAWFDSPEQRALRDQVQRLASSPRWRELQGQMRRLTESPQWREQRLALDRFRRWLDEGQAASRTTVAQPKRPRKKGGGCRPELDPQEIARLRRTYWRTLQRDAAKKKHESAVAELRPKLSDKYRGISDKTLIRHIVKPVLARRRPK